MTTENKKALGKRIKEVRRQLDIKQKDLAKTMDISAGYLSSIESGFSNASVGFLHQFSATYKVSLDYLFHGVGEMFLDTIPEPPPPTTSKREFPDDIETLDDLFRLAYLSPLFKNTLLGFAVKYFYENEDNIKRSIEKFNEKKENKND
ncbi:MAG: helix-turn-helix transcriptional regulator [bacterium]|nr:helix-turn-helix transcriptional regulator [bacterium]